MKIKEVLQHENVDFTGIESSYFLLGLLSAFDNRFQAMADKLIGEISWKQFFAIICINLCKVPPTLNELSDIMGSSHQNVKQILLKLEKAGFVTMIQDEKDKRKQRIVLTKQCMAFCEKHDEGSKQVIERIYEGITDEDIFATIKTIFMMEHNLSQL